MAPESNTCEGDVCKGPRSAERPSPARGCPVAAARRRPERDPLTGSPLDGGGNWSLAWTAMNGRKIEHGRAAYAYSHAPFAGAAEGSVRP